MPLFCFEQIAKGVKLNYMTDKKKDNNVTESTGEILDSEDKKDLKDVIDVTDIEKEDIEVTDDIDDVTEDFGDDVDDIDIPDDDLPEIDEPDEDDLPDAFKIDDEPEIKEPEIKEPEKVVESEKESNKEPESEAEKEVEPESEVKDVTPESESEDEIDKLINDADDTTEETPKSETEDVLTDIDIDDDDINDDEVGKSVQELVGAGKEKKPKEKGVKKSRNLGAWITAGVLVLLAIIALLGALGGNRKDDAKVESNEKVIQQKADTMYNLRQDFANYTQDFASDNNLAKYKNRTNDLYQRATKINVDRKDDNIKSVKQANDEFDKGKELFTQALIDANHSKNSTQAVKVYEDFRVNFNKLVGIE